MTEFDLEITCDPQRIDLDAVYDMLRKSYWSSNIRRTIVDAGAAASILCGAIRREDGATIGFARVVTDRATIAYLCDVFVLPEYRGRGIASRMVGVLETHPDLQTIRRWLLATRDAQGLYARLGYRPVAAHRWMEKVMPASRWSDEAVGDAQGSLPERLNATGQAVGPDVPGWLPPPLPDRAKLRGCHVHVDRLLAAQDGHALFRALAGDGDEARWTYLPYDPFEKTKEWLTWLRDRAESADPLWYSISNPSGEPIGLASYMRMAPQHGAVEIGHILFGPALSRTAGATEALSLMIGHAFDLGYRRVEWKCDSLHAGSRRAAERLGFVFEGIHRRAVIYKGRSRDTAWYSIIDSQWRKLKSRHERWLSSENFDESGQQRERLSDLTADCR